jgi:hypothetical protein
MMTHSLALSSVTMALHGSMDVERRTGCRYPVDAPLEYWVLKQTGAKEAGRGRTVNIASAGVLFTCAGKIPSGVEIEILIHWPSGRSVSDVLLFRATGRTVWSSDGYCAVEIVDSDFGLPE